MILKSLYQRVLIDPVKKGADELFIVSGYATSAMAFHHMEEIQKSECKIRIHLLVGMCSTDGLSLSNHRGFHGSSVVIFTILHLFTASCIYGVAAEVSLNHLLDLQIIHKQHFLTDKGK